jgi:cell division septal protein FtsQ
MSKRIVRKKNSPNRMLFFCFFCWCSSAGSFFLPQQFFFTVESVYVEGASKVDKNEVLTVCGIQQGEKYIRFQCEEGSGKHQDHNQR